MSLLKKTFHELGISASTHDVYIDLLEHGTSTATQIANRLTIPRTSIYDHLAVLINKGLVLELYTEGKKMFSIDDPQNLPKLIDTEIEGLIKEKSRILELLPTLTKKHDSVEPKIRFYSGVDGVRNVLNEFKWQKDTTTRAMWSMVDMIKLLGEDFFIDMNKRRIKQNVYMRGIWPVSKSLDVKKFPYMGTGPEFLRETRYAPKGIDLSIGYWIYGDKVAFLSSQNEAFGFTVHSKDFSQLMKVQFESIWKSSTKMKQNRKHTDAWIVATYKELGKKPLL